MKAPKLYIWNKDATTCRPMPTAQARKVFKRDQARRRAEDQSAKPNLKRKGNP